MKAYTIQFYSTDFIPKKDTEDIFHAIVDGRNCSNILKFHEEISRILQFPSYYGANLDAFFDCLLDLEWIPNPKIIIQFKNFESIVSEELDTNYFKNALLLLISDVCNSFHDPANKNAFTKKIYFLINENEVTKKILDSNEISYKIIS
ncbi:MAG: barstar family protein [Saprospiraceae bacterium]